MKRKIASFAAVFCLLLSAACLPCFVAAEETLPSTESTGETAPATGQNVPVDVLLQMQVAGDRVTVAVTTSDGSLPLGLPVVLTVDGKTAAEGILIDGDIVLSYTVQPTDRLYRVYTENFTLDGKVYGAAMAEEYVDYDDYFLDTKFFEYEDFHFDHRTGLLELTWNYASYGNAHAADVSAVLVDGSPVPFTGSRGTVSADLSDRPNGGYNVELVLSKGDLSATVDVGSVSLMADIKPTITAVQTSDGRLCVTLTDKWGTPLAGIPVNMRVGGTVYLPERTDESGVVYFDKPAGDAKITFYTNDTEMPDGYSVLAHSVLFGESTQITVPPVESSGAETTTTVSTRPPVTTSRTTTPVTDPTLPNPTVTGAGTTSVNTDGMVAMNVTYEQILESLLGFTGEQMADYGRLFMAPSLFDTYVSDTGSSLSLFLRAREAAVSNTEIATSLRAGNVGDFASDNAYRIVVDLDLLLVTEDSSTVMPVLDGQYVVQLPVPEGLQTADACAVAYYDPESGIQKAVLVTPTEGYIRFTANGLGTFVLMGLYPGSNNGGLFWPIMLIVFGCLLVVCGALLVWLRVSGAAFVAGIIGGVDTGRKPAPAAETADEADVTLPVSETHTAPAPSEADRVIAQAASAAAAEEEYEDIFSSAERRDAFNKRDE